MSHIRTTYKASPGGIFHAPGTMWYGIELINGAGLREELGVAETRWGARRQLRKMRKKHPHITTIHDEGGVLL